MTQRVESSRVPYLPVTVNVEEVRTSVVALLDTGFDGDLAVPSWMAVAFNVPPPSRTTPYILADGSMVAAPAYYGTVGIGDLPQYPATIVILGNEVILGLRIAALHRITLDCGRRVLAEPCSS